VAAMAEEYLEHAWDDEDRVMLTDEGLAVLGAFDAEDELAARRADLEAAARRLVASGRLAGGETWAR
jgi:hypothetical protein